MSDPPITEAIGRLDELTRALRARCPWDRTQDERTIVTHTVEEAYELADAAYARDDAKLLDELGDVLFQVHFLSLLLEERGAGDLAAVADHCRRKLIRRHPHVFPTTASSGPKTGPTTASGGPGTGGDASADSAEEVLRNWDRVKAGEAGREPGVFGEVPANLPALLHARKLQRRAASAGLADVPDDRSAEDREAAFEQIGERLFELVDEARLLRVDPELALRAASQRFRAHLEREATVRADT